MNAALSLSVVISTYDRASHLRDALTSLLYQTCPSFEVIVVRGPCADRTDTVLADFSGLIKVAHCPERNLSKSRNIGIGRASGEIIAFMDDDAVAEPEWLEQLLEAYDTDDVAGVGGLVYDHTGRNFQYRYSTCDRLGNPRHDHAGPTPELNFPLSLEVPYLQGTNASFRRAVLIEAGGFDEEYAFYLDETDLCMRLVDRGYVLRQLDSAYVHHRFAPSHIRNPNRITRDRYQVLKNKLYFSIVNTRGHASSISMQDIMRDGALFVEGHEADMRGHLGRGNITREEWDKFRQDRGRAWEDALAAALTRGRLTETMVAAPADETFLPFPPVDSTARGRITVLIVTDALSAGYDTGEVRIWAELAQALAMLGQNVHILTGGQASGSLDFSRGIWFHHHQRITPEAIAYEASLISARRPLDAILNARGGDIRLALPQGHPPVVLAGHPGPCVKDSAGPEPVAPQLVSGGPINVLCVVSGATDWLDRLMADISRPMRGGVSFAIATLKPGACDTLCVAHSEAVQGIHAISGPEDWHAALRGADLVLYADDPGPYGLPLMECAMFMRPVVGFRDERISRVVEHGGSGLLVQAGDYNALRDALEVLLLDREKLARFGARARQLFTMRFDSSAIAGELIEHIRAVRGGQA